MVGRLKGTQSDFKAGYYRIPGRSSTLAIHDLLVTGAQNIGKVTIPEGWTSSKIARHLEAEGVCSATDFMEATRSPELLSQFGVPGKSLEGYLFPDTYFVPRPFPGGNIRPAHGKDVFRQYGQDRPGLAHHGEAEIRRIPGRGLHRGA